jgi:hypothetical protein
MVEQWIVLEHVVSIRGLKVDKAKIYIIVSLSYPSSVQEVHSFLEHVGFYRRFINDFLKIALFLCKLLAKDANFMFRKKVVLFHSCLKLFLCFNDGIVTGVNLIEP